MKAKKYSIETLPITSEFLKEKRFIEPRGELVLLSDGEEIRHITYFSLNPGNKFFRGGHFHRKKIEKFYIVTGQLLLHLVDLETKEEEQVVVNDGERITIYPLCAHRFKAQTPAQVIEYFANPYDPQDDVRYNDFGIV